MKKLLKIIILFSLLSTVFENIYSQVPPHPQYRLDIKNFTLVNPYRIKFDIYLTHTDSNVLEFLAAQHYFKIPSSGFGTFSIGTGVNSAYQFDSAGGQPISELPQIFWPRNPSTVDSGSFIELKLLSNYLAGIPKQGVIINQGDSKLIIRMKLTSTTPLNLSNINFSIKDSCDKNFVPVTRTKVNAYIEFMNTEITRCINHHVDVSGINPSNIVSNAKLAIEGLYNSVTDKLRKRDTVSAYLRNVSSPYNVVDSARTVIDSNFFTGIFSFANTYTSGSYYIVMKYKNAIETWSRAGGDSLSTNIINTYDFTDSPSKAYGNNLVLKGSKYCIYSGDVNYDNRIDLSDISEIDNDALNLSQGNLITDLDGNNITDLTDLAIADNNVFNNIAVIRP